MLIGHSYGLGPASRFCPAHPGRVSAVPPMCGPFVGDWHAGYRAEVLGGAEGCRPVPALESLALRLGLRLPRIEGAGHEPWIERPDAVRVRPRRFVRDAVGDQGLRTVRGTSPAPS
ncbi:hypothetical protein ACIO87_31200 [Streptomyces sp. NPDC087218]|uniref:hypothetical protein n=1 Tax=Streptomyces sp. NPDC087218 TaxID=3365769 RepID=UPI00380DB2EF